MAARGRGLFSLYIYIENFKNLLVRIHSTDFSIILQKCSFGDPLHHCSNHLDSSNNMAASGGWGEGVCVGGGGGGGGAYFPYISI